MLWVNGTHPLPRRRFTLAHELGHAWCRHDGALEPDTVATLSGKTSNPYEIQANAFAAEFLVPAAGFDLGPEPTLEDVVAAAARYGVSAIVIVYRLKQLKLASDARIARLEREIEDGLHAYLPYAPRDDGLARDRRAALPLAAPRRLAAGGGAAQGGGDRRRDRGRRRPHHASGPPVNSRSSSSIGAGAGASAARLSSSMSDRTASSAASARNSAPAAGRNAGVAPNSPPSASSSRRETRDASSSPLSSRRR